MAKTYNTISTFTSGQVLTAAQMNEIGTNSNNYRVPPTVRAVRSSTLSYTYTNDVAWNDTEYDTETLTPGSGAGAMHNDVTNNARITPSTAGIYLVEFSVHFTFSGTSTTFQNQINKNGSLAINRFYSVARTTLHRDIIQGIFTANGTTDFFTCSFDMGGGTSPTIQNNATSYFAATWLGQVS
jgi:hypothetical protein